MSRAVTHNHRRSGRPSCRKKVAPIKLKAAAQRQSDDQHLERAHAVAQTQAREQREERSQGREPSLAATQRDTGAGAPQHEAPQRAMV